MDTAQFDSATHQAYYKTDKHRIRLLVFRSPESPQGWFYQLCDLETKKFDNVPVSDWVSGRTFAKQALANLVGERVEPLTWTVVPDKE